jgi:hypothetical protein
MNNGKAKELMIKLCLSRKQLYSRISKLIRAGLIQPLGSEYSITIFGRVIYEIQIALRLVVENYSKIKNKQQLMKLNTDSLVKKFYYPNSHTKGEFNIIENKGYSLMKL